MEIRRFATNVTEEKTLTQHNGNAVHGELVVNMDTDPPSLYVADSTGNLNPITSVATVSGGNITGSIPADKLTIQVTGGGGATGGSQFLVNKNGGLTGTWLLTLDEGNSMVICQADSFIAAKDVDIQYGQVRLPGGGYFTNINTFLPARNLNLVNTDVLDSSGDPATHSIPVTINDQHYYIHLSTSP